MFGLLRPSPAASRKGHPEPRREPGTQRTFDHVTLNNPATILRLLNQLHFARSRVTLHAENENGLQLLRTSLARVQHRERGGIVLHRPIPSDWQDIIAPGTPVEVTGYLPSGQLSFVSPLRPLEDSGDSQFCTLELPEQIVKYQLRAAFRVTLPPGGSRAQVTLPALDLDTPPLLLDALVLDVSQLGCALRMDDAVLPLLQQRPVLKDLQFDLLNGQLRFTCDAHVRRSAPLRLGQCFAGLQFLPLPDATTRQLQVLLTELQRDQLRRQLQVF